ncbi:hypothetical protein [Geodermatophilus sp. SYSU D00684]
MCCSPARCWRRRDRALGAGGGLSWLVGALVGGIAASCLNAWVLLVEIQR